MGIHDFIIEHEPLIRISVFLGFLTLMGLWELLAPRKAPTISKAYRWVNNLSLIFFNGFVTKLIFPIVSTGMAIVASNRGWGLFNIYELPLVVSVVLFIVLMDLLIYFQHRLVHAVPLLWRLHKVHHADLDYDTSTGARFHTLEILFSMCIKLIAIALLGPAVIAVILFEVILNASAMFNHGNVKLPKMVENVLRLFIVTPDMHRVHHSVEDDELNSNFGFNISLWDRIFGTYKEDSEAGQSGMTIGLKEFREKREANMIFSMLLMPFKSKNEPKR